MVKKTLIKKQAIKSNSISAKAKRVKSSPMKFSVKGKLILARIKTNKNVENTG